MDDDNKWSNKEAESEKVDDELEEVFEAVAVHQAEAIAIPQAEAIVQSKPSKKKNPWKVSVDEAVNYGFSVIGGVLPYLLGSVFLYIVAVVTFFLSISTYDETLSLILFIITIAFVIIGILFQLALTIGLGYKFGSDVLLKAVRTHHSVRKK